MKPPLAAPAGGHSGLVQCRPMQSILVVKTSSLGDVVHALPMVSDLARRHPGAAIDWVVEEAFADVPSLHPAVRHVFPVCVRAWRRAPLRESTRLLHCLARLRGPSHDLVIDAQGLMKSAIVSLAARGPRCGMDFRSAREGLAALACGRRIRVGRDAHAITRNRLLAAGCADTDPSPPPDYGLGQASSPSGGPVCLLTACSRADKEWPRDRWLGLGRHLSARGCRLLLPGGSSEELARAAALAGDIGPAASTIGPVSLAELAALLAGARAVVGVDTGLTHLAAALGAPVLALFGPTRPERTGVIGQRARNLASAGFPDVPGVINALAAVDSGLGR